MFIYVYIFLEIGGEIEVYRASIEEKDVVIGRLQGFRVRDVLETCNECNGVILVISNRRDLECRYNNLLVPSSSRRPRLGGF